MLPFEHELSQIADAGLLRALRVLPSGGSHFAWNGRRYLNFSSNDYLDLAGSDALKNAAHNALDCYGCGASSSPLMTGHLEIHDTLERRLAEWTGMQSALVFGAGFLANLGVVTALTEPGDAVFSDTLNHASIIDGCRLSRATVYRFRHNDMNDLEDLLRRYPNTGRRFIITESLFSMDGDLSPLKELRELADAHDAALIVDEAHALGVFGPYGSGVARRDAVRPDVLVGTLGKSLGSFGGFVAADRNVIELLINRARSFIYSTALPPACAAAALAAIELLHDQPVLGATLQARAAAFAAKLDRFGLGDGNKPSQIVPVIVGDNAAALAAARALVDDGVLAVAIRPPTVPIGTARLRVSLTLGHTETDLEFAAERIARAVNMAPAAAPR